MHRYEDPRDREIVALIASSLAFGTVKQIRASVARALEILGTAPPIGLAEASPADLERAFRGFRHRWITGEDMASLLDGARRAIEGARLARGALSTRSSSRSDPDVAPAAGAIRARTCRERGGGFRACLLPSPESGSACKRLNLFLRWMVRSDAVDPGGWSEVPPAMLIVPLDTHMHRIAMKLGLTERRAADLETAREMTGGVQERSRRTIR